MFYSCCWLCCLFWFYLAAGKYEVLNFGYLAGSFCDLCNEQRVYPYLNVQKHNKTKMKKHLIAFTALLLIALAGCTTPGGTAVSLPQAINCTIPQGSGPEAVATLTTRCQQDAQGTIQAQAAATRYAVEATAQAVAAATQQAQAVVEQTAVAVTSTTESLQFRATEQALAFQQADATGTAQANQMWLQATGTAVAVQASALATAEAQRALNVQMVQQDTARMLANQRAREAFWNAAYPWIVAVVLLVLVGGVAAGIIIQWRNKRPVVQVYYDSGDGKKMSLPIITDGNGGFRSLPGILPHQGGRLALEAGDEVVETAVPKPDFNMLLGWQDQLRLPIGLDADTGQPILINRSQNPHLLIAGKSGAGKSTSGIIPYTLANWGAGIHVVLINGGGADFNSFTQAQNVTVFPKMPESELIEPLTRFLNAAVNEVQRRDEVLSAYNVPNWHQLPAHAGQPGEFLIVIDEFLDIIKAAEQIVSQAQMEKDADRIRFIQYQVKTMWHRMLTITAKARKFGIFLNITLTDPTRELIGAEGMSLRRQMAKIAFRMASADSSRKILEANKIDGFPKGSVGMPNGHFVYNIDGEIGHGVGFYPSAADIQTFFRSRHVPDNPLPGRILDAVPDGERSWVVTGGGGIALPPQVNMRSQAELDGRSFDVVIEQATSLNDLARHLSDIPFDQRSYTPDGNLIRERVRPALQWRVERLGCESSTRLLSR